MTVSGAVAADPDGRAVSRHANCLEDRRIAWSRLGSSLSGRTGLQYVATRSRWTAQVTLLATCTTMTYALRDYHGRCGTDLGGPMSENFDPSQGVRRISRRTVAKGAAWSVPVLMMASATPAFAGSGGIVRLTGGGCKLPGNGTGVYKGYVFALTLDNTAGSAAASIFINSVTLGTNSLGAAAVLDLAQCMIVSQPISVPAGEAKGPFALVTKDNLTSQNGTLTVSYTNGDSPDSASVTASGLNPINQSPAQGCKVGGSCSTGVFTQDQQQCIVCGTWNQ